MNRLTWNLSHLFILAQFLLRSAHGSSSSSCDDQVRVLRVGETRWADQICIGRQSIRYTLQGLQPSTPYEARISFPATNPVRVSLHLEAAGSGCEGGGTGAGCTVAAGSRRLLDAEKIMFRTDSLGQVAVAGGAQAAVVAVVFSAQRLARHRDGEAGAPRVLLYDIVLEESYLGIPRSSFPIIATAVLLVAAVLVLVPWWVCSGVPAILGWLESGTSSTTGAPDSDGAERKRRQ